MSDRRLRLRNEEVDISLPADPGELRDRLEPWLSAVLQSEHLSLLVGNGLTAAIADAAGVAAPSMAASPFSGEFAERIEEDARTSAASLGRGTPNVEDRLRSALALREGLTVLGDNKATEVEEQIRAALGELLNAIVTCERDIALALSEGGDESREAQRLLLSFLLTFSSRSSSRERLNLFTTCYDRLVELGCDLAGLRPIDRFVGALEPVFRSSRLDVDLHYNPPGIRGEPRYLEGVVRIGKIHGSLDWRYRDGLLRRVGLPFGAPENHPELAPTSDEGLMVYPNPAKDVETLLFPYAELMRDMSAAICRPNSAMVTYGYGFGDDHINRVLLDMLSIPSTHLVVISYDGCEGRVERFMNRAARPSQFTLMIGDDLAGLPALVRHYLPKPAIDTISLREADLRQRRLPHQSDDNGGLS